MCFPGLTIGGPRNFPQRFTQDRWSLPGCSSTGTRASTTIKFGGEYLGWVDGDEWHLLERGELIFDDPSGRYRAAFSRRNAALEFRRRWDVTGLDAIGKTASTRTWVTGPSTSHVRRGPSGSATPGRRASNLTINYGVRWDVDWGALAPPDVTTQAPFAAAELWPQTPGIPLFKHDIRDTKQRRAKIRLRL